MSSRFYSLAAHRFNEFTGNLEQFRVLTRGFQKVEQWMSDFHCYVSISLDGGDKFVYSFESQDPKMKGKRLDEVKKLLFSHSDGELSVTPLLGNMSFLPCYENIRIQVGETIIDLGKKDKIKFFNPYNNTLQNGIEFEMFNTETQETKTVKITDVGKTPNELLAEVKNFYYNRYPLLLSYDGNIEVK